MALTTSAHFRLRRLRSKHLAQFFVVPSSRAVRETSCRSNRNLRQWFIDLPADRHEESRPESASLSLIITTCETIVHEAGPEGGRETRQSEGACQRISLVDKRIIRLQALHGPNNRRQRATRGRCCRDKNEVS